MRYHTYIYIFTTDMHTHKHKHTHTQTDLFVKSDPEKIRFKLSLEERKIREFPEGGRK